MKEFCGVDWVHIGTVPANLIGTEEGERLCAEIDQRAQEIRAAQPSAVPRERRKLARRQKAA